MIDEQKTIAIQLMKEEQNQLSEQLKIVDKQIEDLNNISRGLNELKKGDKILANVGKGIFIPSEISEDHLIMELGNKIFVKKTWTESKKIIEEELEKLEEIKKGMNERIKIIEREVENLKGGNKIC